MNTQSTQRVESGAHCAALDFAESERSVGCFLWHDGYLSLANPANLIPIDEPFYTLGRPEREAVPGGTSFCISAGKIPVLKEKLLCFLTDHGANGITADLIYRGSNKKMYDTVQPGYKRFLPFPEYEATGSKPSAQLPLVLPPVFALKTTFEVVISTPRVVTQFHIGLNLETLQELKQKLPRVLIAPLLASSESET